MIIRVINENVRVALFIDFQELVFGMERLREALKGWERGGKGVVRPITVPSR
jgi:hypothetical protein